MKDSKAIFILYVEDQKRSTEFYRQVLGKEPVLDVPGMTEFELTGDTLLGLMPVEGIAKLLGDSVPHPGEGRGIPRCELYLYLENPQEVYEKCLVLGATGIAGVALRNWGDYAGYLADPDGHILALASKS